jgi:MAP3K TRAFs-binding domain
MILLYAGRRSPGPDFPESNEDFVAAQVDQIIKGLAPRRVIGSAAAGADLLVLQAAASQQIPADVLVAGDRDLFKAMSVSDKGARWSRQYDALLNRDDVNIVDVPRHDEDDDTYRAITQLIAQQPEAVLADGEQVVVLIVGRPREGLDHTEDLAQDARARGRLVLRIDPARTRDQCPRAFVAMPFGIKPYPDRGWRKYDADLTYHRVMLPALIDAGLQPMRADTDALLEVIDHTMLREINRAPVMLVDLAMLNANVMWELGVRHAWRSSGTILMAPEWVRAPFDIQRVPVNAYRRGARTIQETELVSTIGILQELLQAIAERRIDSPIFANVEGLEDVDIPETANDVLDDTAGSLLVDATRASDLGDVETLTSLVSKIQGHPDLSDGARTALPEQIGLSLVGLDAYPQARAILAPLAQADRAFERRRLQEQYAHTLIRSADLDDDERHLELAERILRAVLQRHGPGGETLGLLGSAFKRRVERAVSDNQLPDPGHVERAIQAYVRGMEADPGDHYPGINAVALLRLRAQHFGGTEDDATRARELIPVVRFAVQRNSDHLDDLWAVLTLAECALHSHLLDHGAIDAGEANRLYALGAAAVAPQQRGSASRQLGLMRDAGDPPEVIDPLLRLFINN